jgi:LacI family transcriptional regulator
MLRMQGLSEYVTIEQVRSPLDADPTPALRRALSGRNAPTAIMANHDELASRAWRGLARSGLSIPDDVAIMGFDDGPLADGLGLTTVRQPFEESGRVALDLLLGIAAGDAGPVRRVDLMPSLVVRSST